MTAESGAAPITYTPEQERAVRDDARTLCVDAGAGSGKTRVLVDRIVRLLEEEKAGLDEIVAVTFTEKAAAEMKARLRAAFRDRAPEQDAERTSFWRELERRIDGARISTIHGFCGTVLRENALRIGVDPDFQVLAEADAQLLLNETVTTALHELFEREVPAALTVGRELPVSQIQAAMRAMLAHTRTLDRLAEQVDLADPDALSRHWEAVRVQERNYRMENLWMHGRLRVWLRELEAADGWCSEPEDKYEQLRCLLRDSIRTILEQPGAGEVARILQRVADVDMRSGRRSVARNWAVDEERLQTLKDRMSKRMRGWLKDQVEDQEDIDPDVERRAAECTAALWQVFASVRQAYETAKRAVNGVDFDDMVGQTHAVLRANDDVRRRTAQGIRFLLIDEFQDTDATQLGIARMLCDEPDGPDLFIVGDAQQSIYGFRGAEVEVFQDQRDTSAEVVRLDANFRTVPDVLEFVNGLFQETGLLGATGAYQALAPKRPAAGAPCVELLIPPERDGANADDYRREEAELIARRIQGMTQGDAPFMVQESGVPRPARYGDIAILLRATSHVHIYEEALRRAGIPYYVLGGTGFYERQEVIDILNLLKTVLDPWDETALFAFLRSPIAGLSDDALLHAATQGKGLANVFLREAPPESMPEAARWARARALVVSLRAQATQPLPAFLRRVLDETGYEAITLAQYLALQKASNVRKLLELADHFTRTRPPTLRAFVAYLDAVRSEAAREGDAPVQPEGGGAVQVMTVHKSKGLEFPVVCLPDASRGRHGGTAEAVGFHRMVGLAAKVTGADGETTAPAVLAAIRARKNLEDLAEEARVLYVAMTRAREALVISGAPEARGDESWITTLNCEYGVLGLRDGAVFSGPGWQGVVRRRVPEPPAAARAEPDLPTATGAQLMAQTEAVVLADEARPVISVSALLDAMCAADDDEGPRRRAAGKLDPRVRGTLVHRLFELWDFAQNAPPPLDTVLAGEPVPPALRARAVADLQAAAERFAQAPVAAQLAADPGRECEAPFYLALDGALVSGKIDAVLSDGTVVDYKTGRKHAQTAARYEKQVLLYAATVARLRGCVPSRGLVWYADLGESVEVPVDAARIDAVLAEAQAALGHARPGGGEEDENPLDR